MSKKVESPFLTRKEAAAYLRVSPATIDRLIADKKKRLPVTRIGRRVFFKPAELCEWVTKQTG